MLDKEQMSNDVVDDQIDVLGRSLLGLTLACARCHDHKFDPISTADYYALAGIFRSTETLAECDSTPSYWHEVVLEDTSATEQRRRNDAALATLYDEIERLTSQADEELLADVTSNLSSYVHAACEVSLSISS